MSLRDHKKQEKLARIEAAARKLFSEQGYHETSTRALAAEAGIGAGTLFVYFREKRDLLVHLIRTDVQAVIDEAYDRLPARGFVSQCMHLFDALYDHYAKDKRLAQVYATELVFLEGKSFEQMGAFTLSFMMRLTGIIKRAQADDELGGELDATVATTQLFSLYYFSLLLWLSGAISRKRLDRDLRASLQQLVRGLAT